MFIYRPSQVATQSNEGDRRRLDSSFDFNLLPAASMQMDLPVKWIGLLW